MILSLGTITVIAGFTLSWVYETTKEPIALMEQQKQVDAIKAVIPGFTNNPIADKVEIGIKDESRKLVVFPAYNDGKFIGCAVESYSMEGFSGEIDVMFGFDNNGKISGYRVLKHAETPGLGAKMEEWFRMEQGHRSVLGLSPLTENLTVSKDGGYVDGITAATISSRAFLGSLDRAFKAYEIYKTENVDKEK